VSRSFRPVGGVRLTDPVGARKMSAYNNVPKYLSKWLSLLINVRMGKTESLSIFTKEVWQSSLSWVSAFYYPGGSDI